VPDSAIDAGSRFIDAPPADPAVKAADEARVSDWLKANPEEPGDERPTQEPAAEPTQAEPADEAAPDAAPTATTPEILTADQLTTMKRYGLDTDAALEVSKNLSPDKLKKFLANIDERAKYLDTLTQQVKTAPQPAQQPPAAQAQHEGQNPTVTEEHWQNLANEYGEDYANSVKAAVAQSVAPLQQQNAFLQQNLERMFMRQVSDDQKAGFADASVPEGIDIADEATRKKIVDQATALLTAEGYDPVSNNFTHAIPKAVASLFHKEITADARRSRDAETLKQRRGSPTIPNRKPTGQFSSSTQDEIDAKWLAAHPA
jgi:hypothetical protein